MNEFICGKKHPDWKNGISILPLVADHVPEKRNILQTLNLTANSHHMFKSSKGKREAYVFILSLLSWDILITF